MGKLKQNNTKKFNILNINEVCVVEILKIEFCKPVYCIKLQDYLVQTAVAWSAGHYSRRTNKKIVIIKTLVQDCTSIYRHCV